MTIDLSAKELEILDDALKAWQTAPSAEGSTMAIMSSLVGNLAGQGRDTLDPEHNPKEIMRKAMEESKQRERTALLLRAKLAQASSRASEHEVTNPPPHVEV